MERNVTSNLELAYKFCKDDKHKEKCIKIKNDIHDIVEEIKHSFGKIKSIKMSYLTFKKLNYYNAIDSSAKTLFLSDNYYLDNSYMIDFDNYILNDIIRFIVFDKELKIMKEINVKLNIKLDSYDYGCTMEFGSEEQTPINNKYLFIVEEADELNEIDVIDIEELRSKNVKELLRIAKEREIIGRHNMKKDDLIEAIMG